jgi:hypothetical protein
MPQVLRAPRGVRVLALLTVAALTAGRLDAISNAREQYLAEELAAARSRALYLVLDPRTSVLELRVEGFVLHRFVASSALLGSPWGGGAPVWPAIALRLASDLPEPDRQTIPIVRRPATPRGATPPAIELAPQNLSQAPSYYVLRFEPELTVTVVGEGSVFDSGGPLWRALRRLREGWEILGARLAHRPVAPNLLILLPEEESRRLFVALRSGTRLLIEVVE